MQLLKLIPFMQNTKGKPKNDKKRHVNRYSHAIKAMLLGGLTSFFLAPTYADSLDTKPWLKIVPEQCVALLQGQECYVSVELHWQANTNGDYCLYSSLTTNALQCWRNKKQGEFKQEFVSKTNIKFFLKVKQKNGNTKVRKQANIASAEIKMAWVHKKKGKPRTSWRMF